ncbi:MAG: hypothetical protein ACT4QC_02530 [Planctomycetaceae bacterium]
MKFTVLWKPAAEHRLAEFWANSPNRAAVTDAADKIETILRSRPLDEGESRDRRTRVLVVEPLAVHYEVSISDRLVLVLTIHLRTGT